MFGGFMKMKTHLDSRCMVLQGVYVGIRSKYASCFVQRIVGMGSPMA